MEQEREWDFKYDFLARMRMGMARMGTGPSQVWEGMRNDQICWDGNGMG